MLGDQELKQEGFAIVRVDPGLRRFRLESWRSESGRGGCTLMPGWPVDVPFPG